MTVPAPTTPVPTTPVPTAPVPPALADLRQEIDRIDAAMHGLLIERSEIIATLIAVKKTQVAGSAFRPGREAEMMRRLVERHRGLLPLDTAESIWRIIIATFTHVQAPYAVHADISGGDAPMRDSARFHFGFTVPYVPHGTAREVIGTVAASVGDLGIFRIEQGASAGAWWAGLTARQAPKIIARLPFVERQDHPAGTPVYVIAKPLADAAARDIVLYAVRLERWMERLRVPLAAILAEVSASAALEGGLGVLVAASGETGIDRLRQVLEPAGVAEIAEVGSHSARFALTPGR